MGKKWADGYSAHVELRLAIAGFSIPLAQVGPTHFILQSNFSAPRWTTAELLITVDGDERRIDIVLPQGIPADSLRVEFLGNPELPEHETHGSFAGA